MIKIEIETKKQFELVDVTAKIKEAVVNSQVKNGTVVIFNPHTTAAIRINHNEPLLIQDFMKALFRLIPTDISYSHDLFELRASSDMDERSNGHAHVKSFLLGSSENLIIDDGKIILGEKQSIFFVELDGGRKRDFYLQINPV
jgi:secondary thiamine-phosphate synthase enzyme